MNTCQKVFFNFKSTNVNLLMSGVFVVQNGRFGVTMACRSDRSVRLRAKGEFQHDTQVFITVRNTEIVQLCGILQTL